MRLPFVLVVLLSAALAASPDAAKGCLKGAVVGAASTLSVFMKLSALALS